jgi:hypothetical protein
MIVIRSPDCASFGFWYIGSNLISLINRRTRFGLIWYLWS